MKNNIPIYTIDFEGSKAIGIVEYGVVGIRDGKIFSCSTSICSARSKIDIKSERFFGITNETAARFDSFESHIEFFSSLRAKGIFAAHNFHTEDSLLRSYSPCAGRVKNFFTNIDTLAWAPWIDTRTLAKFLLPQIDSEKLANVIATFELQNELDILARTHCPTNRAKWHCALYDALASALIVKTALGACPDMLALSEICKIADSQKELF